LRTNILGGVWELSSPSSRVTLEEILSSDFNLDISRYVTTVQDAVEIDLATTYRKLVEIENTLRQATTNHNKLLVELGLPPLPSHDSPKT